MDESLAVQPVELAVPKHAAALLTLLDHYARDPMGGGQPLSEFARDHLVEDLRARADYVGLLAWRGSEPVGLLNAFEGYSTFAARPLLNIHDLIVLNTQRGRGVAVRLLQGAEDMARRRGCCKLTLEVLTCNRVALAAYARFGFAPYALDPQAGQAILLEKKFA